MKNTSIKSTLDEQFNETQKGKAMLSLIETLAHDFGDILSIVRGYAELSIKSLPKDMKERHNLEKIIQAADRGKELIEHYFVPNGS